MARKNVLKLPREYYYIESLQSGELTLDEMRSEYTRLRKIANRRLKALEKAGFAASNTYMANANKFVPISRIATNRDLQYKLASVATFVSTSRSTVRYQKKVRAETLATLEARGYDFVTADNIVEFGNFMQWFRDKKLMSVYGSQRIADLYELKERLDVSVGSIKRYYAKWLEYDSILSEVDKIPKAKKRTSQNYFKIAEYIKSQGFD